jgi:branched-chain amino acid transport system substrate-binding protein
MKNRKALLAIIAVVVVAVVGWLIYRAYVSPREEVIKIGAILPLTGPGAIFAQYIREGMELAVHELSESSKVRLKILYEDSKTQPKEGVSAYAKLVATERPPVVIVALSSVAKALSPLAEKDNIIQVYIAVAIPGITDGKYRFRVYPEAYGMAGVMARYNATNLRAKTSAVIYINDDFGRVSLQAYQREFEARGGRVVFSESYEPTQTDFRPQIAKLKNVDPVPDVIYLSGYGPAYGTVVKQLKELGVKSQLTADMTLGLPNTLEQVGPAAEGAYFVDGRMSSDFVAKFKKKYGKEPTSYAGYAYDIINILFTIAENKGSFTVDTIREGLIGVKNYQGVMGNITIQPNGDSNLEFVVKKIIDGHPQLIEDNTEVKEEKP